MTDLNTSAMSAPRLVLASTSPFRKELLQRLGLPFETVSPQADETPLPGEAPPDTAKRLSRLKAEAVAAQYPDALIIGSDQVAHLGDEVFGKPGTHARAVQQLQRMSGHSIDFVSGLCLLNARTGNAQVTAVTTRVTMRTLDAALIDRYLRREQPYNCAGSAKSEGLGIALMEKMTCDDPTALIGLPLIALCGLLANEGVAVV